MKHVQYWNLKRAAEPHVIMVGTFGQIYNKMAELEGLPKTNTAGLDTHKYAYDVVWSAERYTSSDSLQQIISDAIDDLAGYEDKQRGLMEIANNCIPVYTQDIADIMAEDPSIIVERLENNGAETIEAHASELIYSKVYIALDDYMENVMKAQNGPVDPQERFICEGCE